MENITGEAEKALLNEDAIRADCLEVNGLYLFVSWNSFFII